MQKLSNAPIDLNPKHTQALRQLTDIFNEAARITDNKENTPVTRVNNTAVPRVQPPTPAPRVPTPANNSPSLQPSTSTDPTAPKVLATIPRVHQRTTRNNTPMPTIYEESRQALQRTKRRDKQTNNTAPQTTRPRQSIAQYRQQQEVIQQATPAKLPNVST
jgi:hypothetical protein